MTLISEPILYTTILLSIFYLISVVLLGNISKNVIPNEFWKKGSSDSDRGRCCSCPRSAYLFLIGMDISARLVIFIYWFMIFVFACWFFNAKLNAVANEASGDPDTTTPIKRFYMMFGCLMVYSAKFIFHYVELVFFKRTEVNPQGQEQAVDNNREIRLPLSYEEEDVLKMGARSDSAVIVSKHQGLTFVRLLFLAGELVIPFVMMTGYYKEKVRMPATFTNPVIIGITAIWVAAALIMLQIATYPQDAVNGYISLTYLRRYGRIFGTNLQGMHGVWFFPQWLVLAICCFHIQANLEFFNDYPRFVFVTFLTVILPFLLSLATGTVASFFYLKSIADIFYVMAYWHVTVNYGGPLGLPFDSASIVTGNPTTSHQWYYWLMDWTNTNFQYRTRDTTGVVTYDGVVGAGYFFAIAGLVLVFQGLLRTVWELFSKEGAFATNQRVELYKKRV